MGIDTILYAVDPDSTYIEVALEAVSLRYDHAGRRYAANEFKYYEYHDLFKRMVDRRPQLSDMNVHLNRRDGKLVEFFYRQAHGQLSAALLADEDIIRYAGKPLGSSAYYRTPELVRRLAEATAHIDARQVTLAEVADIYEGRERRPIEQEFDFFIDILDGLLRLYRQSAANEFGIVSWPL